MSTIIAVTGQTATGKTKYALKLAQEHNGELINIDARQVYQYLDIVTGKDLQDKTFTPVFSEQDYRLGFYHLTQGNRSVPIWLYDIVTPRQSFSAFEYTRCAIRIINHLLDQGKTPILVGGSYFYLSHLLYGIQTENIEPDEKLRQTLVAQSVAGLQTMLQQINASVFDSMNQSDRANPHRLIRKIEILSKKPEVELQPHQFKFMLAERLKRTVDIHMYGMRFASSEKLTETISKRVEERIHTGAIDEINGLQKMGYTSHDPGLQTIGYKQLWRYVDGSISLEEAKEEWVLREKQYAKRQVTFMKKDPHIQWII